MQYRVYFQDSDNFIKESSWNATNQKWYVSKTNITRAKAASPIAAATVGPGDMNSSSPAGIYQLAMKLQYINIYFLDDTNTINELYTTSQDFNSWSPGTLTSQKYVVVETSALTALWHSASTCAGCSNSLLLAYQDQSSQARLINGTQDGWSSYALTMNPITQSGLSLVKMLDINGWINSLRLYYQIEVGNMVSHDWFSPAQIPYLEIPSSEPYAPDSNGWEDRETEPLNSIALSAPIAALTYGLVDGQTTDLVEILSSSSSGIEIVWWTSQNAGGWQPTQNPAAMSGADNYTAIAAHADAKAYMFQQGQLTEFGVGLDGTSWERVGTVQTGL